MKDDMSESAGRVVSLNEDDRKWIDLIRKELFWGLDMAQTGKSQRNKNLRIEAFDKLIAIADSQTRALVPEQLLVEAETRIANLKADVALLSQDNFNYMQRLEKVRALADEWDSLADKFYSRGNDIAVAEASSMKVCAKQVRALTEKSEETR